MNVLKKGTKKLQKHEIECADCGAILEYTDKDVVTASDGVRFIFCPECGQTLFVNEDCKKELDLELEEEKILTIDNIQFPEDFYQFSGEKGALKIDDEEVNKVIRGCLKKLKADRDDFGVFQLQSCGDTLMFMVKYEDEYLAFVCKDYYEASIPR